MQRKALLAGLVLLLAAFGASSSPLHSGSTTILTTVDVFCPELPPDCCRYVFSGGCRMCAQVGC